jgi:hypothetical protein
MTLLDAALDCAQRGWAICPCRPGGKAKGKATRYEGGYKDATTDEAQLGKWWSAFPDDNPAIAPGKSNMCLASSDLPVSDNQNSRYLL